ncbi:MAG: hypothetical protein DRR19_10635 [Candidatus Parabeggiatoa sp. nov. 1]|nr:MAG: hypothetical protein DRR19_10635 [Gammaproteobacteria bacterium]
MGTLHLSRKGLSLRIAPTIENGHVGAILSRQKFLRAKTFASNMVAPNIFEGCRQMIEKKLSLSIFLRWCCESHLERIFRSVSVGASQEYLQPEIFRHQYDIIHWFYLCYIVFTNRKIGQNLEGF